MARIDPPDPEGLTAEQQRVYDAIASGPRGMVRGPLAVWLHRAELADRAQSLGRYCRYDTSLPARLSELAIMTTGRIWGAEYEWWSHKAHALKAGLTEAVLEAIRRGEEPPFEHDDEAAVYAFTVALHRDRRVSDAVYARAVEHLGEPGVVDLTGLLGYYSLISMTINVFGVEPPDGEPRELD